MQQRKPKKKPGACKTCFINFLKKITKDKVIRMNIKQTVVCNFILMLVIFIIGFGLRAAEGNPIDFRLRYDDKCFQTSTCRFLFNVRRDLEGPVYMYVFFKEFFLHHRKIFNSIEKKQLGGESLSLTELQDRCSARLTNDDADVTTSWSNNALDSDDPLNPCGLYASLMPQDNFVLYKKDPTTGTTSNTDPETTDTVIDIKTDKIIWEGLKNSRFKRPKDSENTQWIDPLDERFIEWMKIPMRNNFFKLWGIIDQKIEAGTYLLEIQNDFRLEEYDIHKELVLRQLNWLGGSNPWMFYSYFLTSFVLLLAGGALLYVLKLEDPTKELDVV